MPRPVAQCGTISGYTRHRRLGEVSCDPCAVAKSEYDARRNSASPEREARRDRATAQHRAETRLKAMYPDLWELLYVEELTRVQRSSNPGH
jgi:hypothetical protein